MFLGVSYLYWAALCLVVAMIYLIKWPKPHLHRRPVWLHLVLRWFHSLVWVSMAIGAILFWGGQEAGGQWAIRVALVLYVTFILGTLYDRRTAQDITQELDPG